MSVDQFNNLPDQVQLNLASRGLAPAGYSVEDGKLVKPAGGTPATAAEPTVKEEKQTNMPNVTKGGGEGAAATNAKKQTEAPAKANTKVTKGGASGVISSGDAQQDAIANLVVALVAAQNAGVKCELTFR